MKESLETSLIEIWNKFLLNGDEIMLARIYSENYDLLFDYGRRIVPSTQIVEDAIQDTFISLIKYRKSIGYVKNVKGYLVSSFRRQLFLAIQNHKKLIFSEQLPENFFDYFSMPDNSNIEKEHTEFLHSIVSDCVNNLTDKQREILFLKFESDISYEDISEILNISVESCYKSIYRTVKTIRNAAEKMLGDKENIIFKSIKKKTS